MTIAAPGRLYVVATPIGNLGDLSVRAREVLAASGLVAAEDTRRTGNLLTACGISAQLLSLHDHNEQQRVPEIIERLRSGQTVALVSDAGTPAISDPGFMLVRAAAAASIEVVSVPGPCAAIAALSIAALPTDRFCFEGFLPARRAARRERLAALAREPRTLVFYEAPHRVHETLVDLAASLGADRPATVAREITKIHESVYRGSIGSLAARAAEDRDIARGELVLVVAGAGADVRDSEREANDPELQLDRVLTILLRQLPLKQSAELAAELVPGVRGNEAYRRALALRDAGGEGEDTAE